MKVLIAVPSQLGLLSKRRSLSIWKLAIGNDEGIAFVHIADFLLMDKW